MTEQSPQTSLPPHPPVEPWFGPERQAGLEDFWAIYDANFDLVSERAMASVMAIPELAAMVASMPAEVMAQQRTAGKERLRRAISGDWAAYEADIRMQGPGYAAMGISFRAWHDVISAFTRDMVPLMIQAYGATPDRLAGAILCMYDLMDRAMALLAEEYLTAKQRVIEEQQRITHERTEEARRHSEAAGELRKAKDAAELANQELEAFSYSVAHDLRSPLRGVDGFSQALLEDYGDQLDDAGKDYLRRLRAAAQRMSRLIDDLLTLSRVTRGDLRQESVDLSGTAKGVAARLRDAQPARDVEVVIEESLTAWGDGRLLQLVLENLLGNAFKFTCGRPRARIELGAERAGDGTTFYVRDDGAGFDMKYADKLFGAFQRLHNSSEFEGTGIGLATVQRIVRRHGGRVWAEGAVGKGATVYFTLSH